MFVVFLFFNCIVLGFVFVDILCQYFWFDLFVLCIDVVVECCYWQEWFVVVFWLFVCFGFVLGFVGYIIVCDLELFDYFWVNLFGVYFLQIKVFDLLFVNVCGEIVIGQWLLNKVVFVIYVVIYEVYLYVVVVVYMYLIYGKVWLMFGCLFDLFMQDVCVFYEDYVLFDDFMGMVVDISEGVWIVEVFVKLDGIMYKGVILKNYGILMVGLMVEVVVWWYIVFDNVVYMQLLVEVVGMLQLIDYVIVCYMYGQIGGFDGVLYVFDSLFVCVVVDEFDLFD